ncbi:MAG: endolytic transglycosylase MltG [Sphingobacteriales bacterium]
MRKLFFIILVLILTCAGGFAWWIFLAPNINSEKKVSIKIRTGSTYDEVVSLLSDNNILKDEFSFSIVSRLKHYPEQVRAGYYVFNRNMNNRQIVNMLRLGLQTPVTLVIYNIRTKEEFAGLIGRTIEIDSAKFLSLLDSTKFCRGYGLDTNNILTRIQMDNYEFYWNTHPNKFFEKIDSAYSHFWNDERRAKAQSIHLTPTEVTILASIVEKEVMRDKELPTVAGVYLNRLKIGMPLQADPTLVFALRDFDARRVTSYHKEYDSPYNTYKYAGLPPGPVCIPRKKSIEAVLNAEQHDFLYFCANPDLSGYSIFSKTYEEQMKTAAQYRKKLDEMHVH